MLNKVEQSDLPLRSLMGYLVKRVSNKAIATLADDLSPLKLRITEATILWTIEVNNGITASEIGRQLGIKRANMAPLISRLIDRNYVLVSSKDGRSQCLDLTPEGYDICSQAQKIMIDHDNEMFSMLTPKEKIQFLNLLIKIRNN